MLDESKVVEAESSGAQDEKSLRDFWVGLIAFSVLINIVVNLVFGFQVDVILLAFIFGIISGGKGRKDVFRAIRRMLLGGVIGCIVGAVMYMLMATVVRGATIGNSLPDMLGAAVLGARFGAEFGLMSVICARDGIWHQTLLWCAIGSIVGVILCAVWGMTVDGGIPGTTFWNWAASAVIGAIAGAEFGVASGGWRVLVILGWFLN